MPATGALPVLLTVSLHYDLVVAANQCRLAPRPRQKYANFTIVFQRVADRPSSNFTLICPIGWLLPS